MIHESKVIGTKFIWIEKNIKICFTETILGLKNTENSFNMTKLK